MQKAPMLWPSGPLVKGRHPLFNQAVANWGTGDVRGRDPCTTRMSALHLKHGFSFTALNILILCEDLKDLFLFHAKPLP